MTVPVTARMLQAFDIFMQEGGFHDKGASAPVGNFCQESGPNLDSTMYRAHPDASGGVAQALKSGGIAEWLGDRKLAYIAFSEAAEKARGLAAGTLLNDLRTQCLFCIHELQTTPGYAGLLHQLTTDTGRAVANLTANFMEIYERPAPGPTAGLDNRIDHAQALYDRVQTIKAAAPAAPAPSLPSIAPSSIPTAPMPQVPSVQAPDEIAEVTNLELSIMGGLDQIVKKYETRIASDTARRDFFESIKNMPGLIPPNVATKLAKQSAAPSNQKVNNMQNILGANWKTTVSGLIAAASQGIGMAFPQYSWITNLLTPIALGALGLSAKDGNVTGGSVAQTVEAQSRSASAPVK